MMFSVAVIFKSFSLNEQTTMNMPSRDERNLELQTLANTHEGCESIRRQWNEVKGNPEGSGGIGVLVRQEMIADILVCEYPNG